MTKKLFLAQVLSLFLFAGVLIPYFAHAQPAPGKEGYSLVLQDCVGSPGAKPIPGAGDEKVCGYKDFLKLVNRVITLLLYLAVTLAVISFVYAGFKLLFSGGNEEAVKHAKHIFTNVVVGLIFAYGAWIIVNFIISALGVNTGYDLIR